MCVLRVVKGAYLMGLTDLYRKAERILREKEYGWVLDAVEKGSR
jgi:hypothetical protein